MHNAAIAVDGLLMRVKTADWHRAGDQPLFGILFVPGGVAALAQGQERGRIINLTSVVGRPATPAK